MLGKLKTILQDPQTQGPAEGFLSQKTEISGTPRKFSGGFPGGLDGTASVCSAGDLGSIPGLGRSPGEGNGNPLQYSCLENPMDGGAQQATAHGVVKSRI